MYGRSGRIGLLVPSTNFTAEVEFQRAVPEGVSVHTARCLLKDSGQSSEERLSGIIEMSAGVSEAARRVCGVRPKVVAWACTAGSFLKGLGHDQELIRSIEAATGARALTTSTAVVGALKALEVRRLAVATPYIQAIDDQEKRFLEASIPGLEVVSMKGLGIVKAYDKGVLEPESAYDAARQVDHRDADAVFISCTAWRTFEVIPRLETELAKPVITSNQATLWACLKVLGCGAAPALGQLMERSGPSYEGPSRLTGNSEIPQ